MELRPCNQPSALAAHLQGEVTRLASLLTITRKDGVVFQFTDHNRSRRP